MSDEPILSEREVLRQLLTSIACDPRQRCERCGQIATRAWRDGQGAHLCDVHGVFSDGSQCPDLPHGRALREAAALLASPPVPSPLETAARVVVETWGAAIRLAANTIPDVRTGSLYAIVTRPADLFKPHQEAIDALERALGEGEPPAELP